MRFNTCSCSNAGTPCRRRTLGVEGLAGAFCEECLRDGRPPGECRACGEAPEALTIKEWQVAAYENSADHGFHPIDENPASPIQIAAWLALLHSEVSEALECAREGHMETTFRADGKPEGFMSELADIFIRLADTAQACGGDLEAEVRRKHEYNRTRPHKHGGKRL